MVQGPEGFRRLAGLGLEFQAKGIWFQEFWPIMENQPEQNMGHEMETEII